jgi:plasmid stability protein
MTAPTAYKTELELSDFPKDIQQVLKLRAITNCRSIEEEIRAFALDTARRTLSHQAIPK